jgi:hypothetical protein
MCTKNSKCGLNERSQKPESYLQSRMHACRRILTNTYGMDPDFLIMSGHFVIDKKVMRACGHVCVSIPLCMCMCVCMCVCVCVLEQTVLHMRTC